ncbi:response regulator transcription factor [Microvirga sp. KLBC 81]|uniref:response regulator transcription factor n=1 Tax=Microvirga sp. KLBC 81 TaxID=1862707 RepID=UPI001FE16954|nr:response regulator [Microvirga sp. KLBC 81]
MQKAPVISIVDDDESVRDAIRSLLRALGYVVDTFASAEDYLQSPHLSDTSCLITDIQMPGMNGFELQRRLVSKGLQMPVIFMTAFPEEAVSRLARDAGAVSLLSKPFDEQALISCLDRALTERGGGITEGSAG